MSSPGSDTSGRVWLCRPTVGVLGALAFVVGVAAFGRRRQRHNDPGTPRIHEILQRCETVSLLTFDVVLGHDHSCGETARWQQAHAVTIGLDRDISSAATAARDPDFQRSLDGLAASAIALRGSLEARARATGTDASSRTIRAANDDLLIVRCEDLLMTARNLEGRTA